MPAPCLPWAPDPCTAAASDQGLGPILDTSSPLPPTPSRICSFHLPASACPQLSDPWTTEGHGSPQWMLSCPDHTGNGQARPFRKVFPYLTWQNHLPLFKKWSADQCGSHDHSSELFPGLMDEMSALCTEKFYSKNLYPRFCLPPCKKARTMVEAERKVLQLR